MSNLKTSTTFPASTTTPNLKISTKQSKKCNKSLRKSFRDLMSDSLSQSNASSIHESSDMSSINSFDDSMSEHARGDSPSHLGSFCYPLDELRKKYKREFKDAIRKNYRYMMSENIMDSCKLTENEFSAFDSDEISSENNAISYNEFVRQYQELITWLTNMHDNLSQNQINCCNSEKYLNQAHHEELLHRLTRRTQFQEYSNQLIVHYPSKKEDIIARCNHIDQLWMDLEKDVVPGGSANPLVVIKDIEQDLQNFENWILKVENEMNQLKTIFEIQSGIQQFIMDLQREIQSKSKFVTSILQMCENLLANNSNPPNIHLNLGSSILDERVNGAKSKAMMLQHRWEAVYINCLEWQLRSEGNVKVNRLGESSADDSDDTCDGHTDDVLESSNGLSIIEEEKEDVHSDNADANVSSNLLRNFKLQQVTHDGDIGYSSDGQQSPNLLQHITNTSVQLEGGNRNSMVGKLKMNECNIGSDMSDSSGVAISTATGSLKSKSDNATNSDGLISGSAGSSGDSIGTNNKIYVNYDSSVPATEDEFSNDEIKNATNDDQLAIFSKSMDVLIGCHGRTLKNMVKDESVSDGEILVGTSNNLNRFHVLESLGCWNKHKTRLHLNEDFSKESIATPTRKTTPRKYRKKIMTTSTLKRLPQKRTFNNYHGFSSSDGCLANKIKQENSSYVKVRKVMSFEGLNFDLRRGYDDDDENEEEERCLINFKGLNNIIDDQCVPDDDLVSNTADEMSSFQSEVETTDVETEDASFKSNVDMWLEDNIFDRGYYKTNKHSSTPKSHLPRMATSKQLPFSDYTMESDSDAEDFKVVLDELHKALTFTEQIVQQILHAWSTNSQSIPDASKLMEPLATCETSIKCLQELKGALMHNNNINGISQDSDYQIIIIEGLLKKWLDLKAGICEHHQRTIDAINCETLRLEQEFNKSLHTLEVMSRESSSHMGDEDDDKANDDDDDDVTIQVLVDIIKAYKVEKDNLFALKEKLNQLMKKKKMMATMKMSYMKAVDDGVDEIGEKRCMLNRIEELNDSCMSHLNKVTNIVSSLISVIEPCSKFIQLKKEVTTSLDQSDACLQEVGRSHGNTGSALVELLSTEMKGGWIALNDKVSQMHHLNSTLHDLVPLKVQRSITNDLEKVDGRYKDLQMQSSNIIKKIISSKSVDHTVEDEEDDDDDDDDDEMHQQLAPTVKDQPSTSPSCIMPTITSTTNNNGGSGVARLMRRILKVGVPISAAVLFLGWMYTYSNVNSCGADWFGDWGIVIFPNLKYTRGRPAI